ncbi:zinc finger protein SHOOT GRAVITROPISM 5-like [Triticum dicoccoides]|uniref:zinc finger protein SHOOT GRAVITROPISM 5-like n=1 Tax=Triticum dicoccoides TaxID=85692 RepID=UPI001890CBF4|nr:zinc finger protein SHOOT GRAVITROPISM 5-like [Triticum dicoccoides]
MAELPSGWLQIASAPTAVPATNELEETAELPSGWLQIATTSSATKRKRRRAGTPDPGAEVVALSPRALLEPKTYACEACDQGFLREAKLQTHRRWHRVPWEQPPKREAGNANAAPPARKRVFLCPEPSCVHRHPSHALRGLAGIKNHFRRKHVGPRQRACSHCSGSYAVHDGYIAHLKTCCARLSYPCRCGRVFFRVDKFAKHQYMCSGGPPQADVSSAPVREALWEPRQPAAALSLSSFPSPFSDILIDAAMRSPAAPTFHRLFDEVPPPDTSCVGHDLELRLMLPSCHAAPRSPPAPISRGDDDAIQLQLSMALCSGDS